MPKKQRRSGIYLLPNLFTTGCLFAAFYSIVASLHRQHSAAAIAIFIGMVADGLDGRIARLTKTQTPFGAQYDSLSDMVTFGVAPALLLYSSNLHKFGEVGWLIAFIFTATVALRLARFNTQIGTMDKKYFQGLPCPSAAAIIAAFCWLGSQFAWSNIAFSAISGFLAIITGILMVSNIRYYSFKELDFKGKIPFLHLLLMLSLFVAVAIKPAVVILFAFLFYALFGPVQTLIGLSKVRKQRRPRKRNS